MSSVVVTWVLKTLISSGLELGISLSRMGQNARMDPVLSCLGVGSSLPGFPKMHADCILQGAHRTGWKSRGRERGMKSLKGKEEVDLQKLLCRVSSRSPS